MSEESIRLRQLLLEEREALEGLCGAWESRLEEDAEEEEGEERTGAVRAAIGRCRMLLAPKGRMTQFEGLLNDAERVKTRSQKPIGDEDLRGFWDVLSFQIDDAREAFRRLEHEDADAPPQQPQAPQQPQPQKPPPTKPPKTKAAAPKPRPKPKKPAAGGSSIKDFIAKKRLEAQNKKAQQEGEGNGGSFLVL